MSKLNQIIHNTDRYRTVDTFDRLTPTRDETVTEKELITSDLLRVDYVSIQYDFYRIETRNTTHYILNIFNRDYILVANEPIFRHNKINFEEGEVLYVHPEKEPEVFAEKI